MNRKFEIGFILNPELSSEEIKKILDSIVAVIKKEKGVIENIDEWGRKKLAYPIKKHDDGNYIFMSVDAPGSAVAGVERLLKLNEKVIRFLVLRLDERLKKTNKLVKKWKKSEKYFKKREEVKQEIKPEQQRNEKSGVGNEA